ncbi:hypothetical protein KRX54_04805 [Actinomycetaceae bacterium TAE3-ERU4]|nr:hypothetical protein [Actinomycetaceae bacterium TAE3-ERU4]
MRKRIKSYRRQPREHKSQEYELDLLAPAHGGFCVARQDGKTFFVRGGIPGEKVIAKSYAKKAKIIFAQTVKVNVPSSLRIGEPQSELVHQGADLAYLSSAGQLEWKITVLRDCLRRIGTSVTAEAFEPLFANGHFKASALSEKNGRTRCEFVIDNAGNPAMHIPGSIETQKISAFFLGVPTVSAHPIFQGKPKWKAITKPGDRVRIIDVSEGTFVRVGDQWYDEDANLVSLEKVTYKVRESNFLVNPSGFWQAHRDAPKALWGALEEALTNISPTMILELFSGAGLLTKKLYEKYSSIPVLALEGDPGAVQMARKNIPHVPAEETYIDKEAVEKALKNLRSKSTLAKNLEPEKLLIVADPPRQGLGPELAGALVSSEAEKILLISCDPASMAADARILIAGGYSPIFLNLIDLFPGTHHFETVCLYARK